MRRKNGPAGKSGGRTLSRHRVLAPEFSAGGIIASRYRGRWYVLLMKDMNGNWTFPKGKIERGEQPEASAVREIEEEVGIKRLSLVSPLTPSRYWYYRNGTIRKTVYYYLFRSPLRAAPRVQTEEGITDAVWTLWQDAYETVGYPETNVPLLREAERALPPT